MKSAASRFASFLHGPLLLLAGGFGVAVGPFLPWHQISVYGFYARSSTQAGVSIDQPVMWGLVLIGSTIAWLAVLAMKDRHGAAWTILTLSASWLGLLALLLLVRAWSLMHPRRVFVPNSYPFDHVLFGFWLAAISDVVVVIVAVLVLVRASEGRWLSRTFGI